ncbi:MAG: hypothetical protein JNL58_26380 [Planctomyces sp.]|nr:hypothetical protein [Planctomyces sp.]
MIRTVSALLASLMLWIGAVHGQEPGTQPPDSNPPVTETPADPPAETPVDPSADPAAPQDTPPTADVPADATTPPEGQNGGLEKWDRLIYIPFRELQKVFDNQDASVVIPYSEYLELMKRYLEKPANGVSPDAVITSSSYKATVEKDVVRISADLRLNVLRKDGWASLPLTFGTPIGKVTPDDGTVLLKGTGQGQYELLIQGAGQRTISLELLATVQTSPENKSFQIQCPPTGISELLFTVPEADQSIAISPVQVLLPVEAPAAGTSTAKASLGSVNHFQVQWNPRAGSKPVMDLLASATNTTTTRIDPGLIQTKSSIQFEILRGELREVSVLVPKDARIIDVVSQNGRIRAWNASEIGETHQQILIELLNPVSDAFQVEIQTERNPTGDVVALIGKAEDGKLQGVHAEGVVREAGRLTVSTDPSLTAIVKQQAGMKQVEVGGENKPAPESVGYLQAWEFSGSSGTLVLQTKPVEPRLLVNNEASITFRDDELRLRSVLNYTIERAGVFQLVLTVPVGLTIDSVNADGMSEFNVDKESGRITLSLTQKRMGAISVTVLGHQAFDSRVETAELELPSITPEGVERETGSVTVFSPQFLDVISIDEKLIGVFPSREAQPAEIPARMRHIGTWNYTRRPISVFARTAPRPAQLAATVGTTIHVEPELVRHNSVVSFDIQNAGLDTLRIAVPEAVASDVRFQAVSPGHTIQQRNKAAQAEEGWVTWTLVLQDEATGTVQISVDWEVSLEETPAPSPVAAATADAAVEPPEQTYTIEPPRVLAPFTAEQAERRRVTLTQARGEIRLLRHESLSIAAAAQGDTVEAIDVRELELIEQDGYLAFRYFSQPASAQITIRKHELHEVVATVVSRAAIEVVTEKQPLAAYRCRFLITTSERQRLRIDVPAGSDLQSPLLQDQRTTIEKATDVKAAEGWDPYYVNISRESGSDTPFLLTLQFRTPISEDERLPYDGRGSIQILRLPLVGTDDGSTVIQQTRLAIWAPVDTSFIGNPDHWTQYGRALFNVFRPNESPSSVLEATTNLNRWIGGGESGDFATQGNASVYRSVGRHDVIEVSWWNRPFLFWIISGTLVVVGFILKATPWENRITLLLLAAFAVAMWSIRDGYAAMQFISAALPGLGTVGVMWIIGLILGRRPSESPSSGGSPGGQTPSNPKPSPPPEGAPDTTVTSSEADVSSGATVPPEASTATNDQTGGKQ